MKVGMRYYFQPRMCMLQWRHSGLVNYFSRNGKTIRCGWKGLGSGNPSAEIFPRQQQAEKSLNRQFGGLGFGLWRSAKQCWKCSAAASRRRARGQGKGATFGVRLPLVAAPGQRRASAKP